MLEAQIREPKSTQRKESKGIEGKRITAQQLCHQNQPKHRPRADIVPKQTPDIETFRTVLTKRDRHKESQSKLEHRPLRRHIEENKEDKQPSKKQASKSRSKSKGLHQSKSMKQLVKKSKSMARLQPRREQRKSESPPFHTKSTTSHGERKQCKSHYNSKTTREIVSEQTTDRQKLHKSKQTKVPKRPKSELSKKMPLKVPVKKGEKENLKMQSKFKKKPKKVKRVLVSQEHSKIRRECEQWQMSLNEDEFLDPRHKAKSKKKLSNIVQLPRRKERLSLNANHPRKPSLKNKTQVQHQLYHYHKLEHENHAATTIQRIFRGYLTRKYIKECFQHNAALKIQKVWRGYRERQIIKTLKSNLSITASPYREKPKILEQSDYLLQKSSEALSGQKNQKWNSLLQEILSEENVSINMKRKIEFFLQSQHQSLYEFNPLQELKSPSARSSISSQVIHNEIASERHFIEKQRLKKDKPVDHNLFLSPKQYMSPQPHQFCSPQNRLNSTSPARSSTQLLIVNLKNIQRAQRVHLQTKATKQKQELNKMLIKHTLSPRTHEKMYKEVDMMLESQLEKFNQSINQIVKNCMVYGQEADEVAEESLTTPKKQLKELHPPDFSPTHQHQPSQIPGQQMSLQLREYYQLQKQNTQKPLQYEPFDTSYQFIQQYLISLIDFVRQYEGGQFVSKVIANVHKARNHDMEAIFRNSKPVTENSDDEDNENSFRLPMYKYIDLDEPILDDQLVESFNKVFQKINEKPLGLASSVQEHFLKMITESMNEALNSLRPQIFPFSQCNLSTLNILKGLEKIPFECQSSQQEMHYQYICAQALNKIFYWNRLEWGKIIRISESQQNYHDSLFALNRDMEISIVTQHVQDDWTFYEQLIEIIGELTQEIFQTCVFEQIASVWDVLLNWNHKIGRQMQIQAPDNKNYFQQ